MEAVDHVVEADLDAVRIALLNVGLSAEQADHVLEDVQITATTSSETADDQSAWSRLDELLESGLDIHAELTVASETCWDCKITVVSPQEEGTPDHGQVVYAVAGASAEAALNDALSELGSWLLNIKGDQREEEA